MMERLAPGETGAACCAPTTVLKKSKLTQTPIYGYLLASGL